MIAAPAEKYISAEEFMLVANSVEYADRRVELVDGVIVEMGKPGWKHGNIVAEFTALLRNHVKPNGLGKVNSGDTAHVLGKKLDGRDTVRGIDIAFVAAARIPADLPDGSVPFAPDLAVEVISPGNEAEDIHEKVLELLNAGCRLVLVLYPNTETIVAHTQHGARTYFPDDTLDFGDVLPGFTLAVRAVFDV
ncbi:MAG: Uma2 family endonuclease [Chloroflexota bacterium]|nr:Uma2 family endonuclease [Chloroflexota bacterium]